jgi:hypothetical protein
MNTRYLRAPSNVARASSSRTLHAVFALLLVFTFFAHAQVHVPDRRELWVPFDQLGRTLADRKAVVLSREQYSALLRDAGLDKTAKPSPPRDAAVISANYTATLDGKVALIALELRVHVLTDGWAQVPLDFHGAALGGITLDEEAAFAPVPAEPPLIPGESPEQRAVINKLKPPQPQILLLRGKGEHSIRLSLSSPVQTAAGLNTLALVLPPAGAGVFTLALPPGARVEGADLPVSVTSKPEATFAKVALMPRVNNVAIMWRMADAAPGQAPVAVGAEYSYRLDAEKLAASFAFDFGSALGDLPLAFDFVLPPAVKVTTVDAPELAGWNAKEGRVGIRLQPGARRALKLRLDVEQPVFGSKEAQAAELTLPVPVLATGIRISGQLVIHADDSLVVRDIATDARRVPGATDAGGREFSAGYVFSRAPAVLRVDVARSQPRFEADVDTLAGFRTDAIFIERTITLREVQGRRFDMLITLPDGEELLSVRRETRVLQAVPPVQLPSRPPGQQAAPPPPRPPQLVTVLVEPEWRAEKNAVTIQWTDESAEPRVFKLRSRVEPPQWTQLPAEGVAFKLTDAKIADAAKITGYIALIADAAFRIEPQPGETLERRDGRTTPVRGDHAWFRRDAFDLAVRVTKRPAEVLATLTGYALPLEGVLDLHATMNYAFLHGGTRAVKLRVPKELAANFHFEGPNIAERTLAEDVWTITFQKELTGAYALAITAQVPVEKKEGDRSTSPARTDCGPSRQTRRQKSRSTRRISTNSTLCSPRASPTTSRATASSASSAGSARTTRSASAASATRPRPPSRPLWIEWSWTPSSAPAASTATRPR